MNTQNFAHEVDEVKLKVGDDIRSQLVQFKNFEESRDSTEIWEPRLNVVDNALNFLEFWTGDIEIFEPELHSNGVLALQIYDMEGFTNGGIKFYGEHKAYFSIIDKMKSLTNGEFDARSESTIKKSVVQIIDALGTI